MSLIDELKNQVIEEEAEELGLKDIDESYKILDDESANFFLKRLTELHDEATEVNDLCDSEIEKYVSKVNSFRKQKISSIDRTISYFESLLENYASEKLKDTNKKSLKLPFGTLQYRKSQSKYDYDDNVLAFLKTNHLDNLISVKEDINKSELKKVATIKDGRAYINDIEIPGVTITDGEINFSVKLN